MTNQTPTVGTITEALARSISELRQLVTNVGTETRLGLALTTVKGALQRIDQGLPAEWLSVAAAINRVNAAAVNKAGPQTSGDVIEWLDREAAKTERAQGGSP